MHGWKFILVTPPCQKMGCGGTVNLDPRFYCWELSLLRPSSFHGIWNNKNPLTNHLMIHTRMTARITLLKPVLCLWHFGTDPDPPISTVPLTYGSGSCSFRRRLSRCQPKISFLIITLWRYICISLQKINSHKDINITTDHKVFLTFFLIMEWSGSRSRSVQIMTDPDPWGAKPLRIHTTDLLSENEGKEASTFLIWVIWVENLPRIWDALGKVHDSLCVFVNSDSPETKVKKNTRLALQCRGQIQNDYTWFQIIFKGPEQTFVE